MGLMCNTFVKLIKASLNLFYIAEFVRVLFVICFGVFIILILTFVCYVAPFFALRVCTEFHLGCCKALLLV